MAFVKKQFLKSNKKKAQTHTSIGLFKVQGSTQSSAAWPARLGSSCKLAGRNQRTIRRISLSGVTGGQPLVWDIHSQI